MKKSIIIGLLAGVTAMGFTSCLDTESDRFVPVGELTMQDSVYHMLGVLNNMKLFGPRYILLGELRADLMTSTEYATTDLKELSSLNVTDANEYTSQKEYYEIINQCNYIIQYGSKALPKEVAVATTLRAWTYLQLVLNYGKARYYTNFIGSDAEAYAEYPEYGIDELAEAMIPQLESVKSMPLPAYGSIGGTNLRSQMMDARFMLGEFCLWKGEYERAAEIYYSLIKDGQPGLSSPTPYLSTRPLLAGGGSSWNNSQSNKYLSPVGNSARSMWGRFQYDIETPAYINYPNADSTHVRSNIDTLCGYPSYETEDIAINASSVARSLWKNTEYAYTPNESDYYDVNYFLRYVNPVSVDYGRKGDLRERGSFGRNLELMGISGSTYYYSVEGDSAILKYTGSSLHRKDVTLYRVATLYLRYAEAVNRAGKPNLAMIALKYGLNSDNITLYMPSSEKPPLRSVYDQDGNPIEGAGAYRVYSYNQRTKQYIGVYRELIPMYTATVDAYNGVVPYDIYSDGTPSDTLLYCFNDSVLPYYNFSNNAYLDNAGLHGRGAGCAAADITFKMPKDVHPGDVTKQIEYMEDILCNEYALETAFEGNRFHDLMRFSRYQNTPKFLADRVSKKPGIDPGKLANLATPGAGGWDSESWYIPIKKRK